MKFPGSPCDHFIVCEGFSRDPKKDPTTTKAGVRAGLDHPEVRPAGSGGPAAS